MWLTCLSLRKLGHEADTGHAECIGSRARAAQSAIELLQSDGKPTCADCEYNECWKDEENRVVRARLARHRGKCTYCDAGGDVLLLIAYLLLSSHQTAIELCAGRRLSLELAQVLIGLQSAAATILPGIKPLQHRLLNGNCSRVHHDFGLGDAVLQAFRFSSCGFQSLFDQIIHVELDSAVHERSRLPRTCGCMTDRNDAGAALPNGLGISFK